VDFDEEIDSFEMVRWLRRNQEAICEPFSNVISSLDKDPKIRAQQLKTLVTRAKQAD
jgi:hypothetical protein